MLNQNARTATEQSTTEFGQNEQESLQDSESTKPQEYSESLDPVQELYKGPDHIEEAEQVLADCEAYIDFLVYSKDVMYHTLTLEFMRTRPTATAAKVKSMVTIDGRMNKLETDLQAAKRKYKAAKIYFNKMQNKFISARKLTNINI